MGHILENQELRAVQLRLKYLLNGEPKLKPGLGHVLLKLDEWIAFVRSSGLDSALDRAAGRDLKDGQDIVRKITDYLLNDVEEADRDLLRKSLLETLLSLFALDPELHPSEFSERFLRFLKFNGASALTRHFLSLHVFNLVWLQTMELFRGLAQTQDTFMKDMQSLEHVCSVAVDASWKSAEVNSPLDTDSVRELLGEIERHLWGDCVGK